MRFKLYEVEIERVSGWSQHNIVAESKERAADLAIEYEFMLQREHIQLALKRVDETLTGLAFTLPTLYQFFGRNVVACDSSDTGISAANRRISA